MIILILSLVEIFYCYKIKVAKDTFV